MCWVTPGSIARRSLQRIRRAAPRRAVRTRRACAHAPRLAWLAPSVVGAVSDQSKTRPDALQLAMVGVALTALVASVVLLWPLESRYVPLTAAARAEEQDLASV